MSIKRIFILILLIIGVVASTPMKNTTNIEPWAVSLFDSTISFDLCPNGIRTLNEWVIKSRLPLRGIDRFTMVSGVTTWVVTFVPAFTSPAVKATVRILGTGVTVLSQVLPDSAVTQEIPETVEFDVPSTLFAYDSITFLSRVRFELDSYDNNVALACAEADISV